MDTQTVASNFTALCKAGKMDEAGKTYWSDDIRSVEAMQGDMADLRGREAVEKKGEWWASTHEVHSVETEGPFVNGDQFVLRFHMDVTARESGQRMQMTEAALYTVRDGKVVEERFFGGG